MDENEVREIVRAHTPENRRFTVEFAPVNGTFSLLISDKQIGTTLHCLVCGVDNPGAVKDIVVRLNADLTEDRNHSAYIRELAELHGVKQ